MSETIQILNEFPELRSFVLHNVRPTGIKIGSGAYGSVEEVAIPGAICAVKKIHDIFLDRSEIPPAEIRRATAQFVKECQLMSNLHHPNIVQFLGVTFFPGSRLPALVMERLLTSLHDLLDPEETLKQQPTADTPRRNLPSIPLRLKCSILHGIACGLAYLHGLSPPVAHRDLSAKNVLLDRGMMAKIVDLGMARIMPCSRTAATMTTGPGASVYMPPEASAPAKSNSQKSKYDSSIDVFSFGVVTIFTIGLVVGRTELQCHSEYMHCVAQHLRACGQFHTNHPLILLIEKCLQNMPTKRPAIDVVLKLLEEAKTGTDDDGWEKWIAEKNLGYNLQQQLDSKDKEIIQLRLHSQEIQDQLRIKEKQLSERESELIRAEEAMKRYQKQIHVMENRGSCRGKVGYFPTSYVQTVSLGDKIFQSLYDYTPKNHDELSLSEKQIVVMLRDNQDGWMFGKSGTEEGLFPGNYTKKLTTV